MMKKTLRIMSCAILCTMVFAPKMTVQAKSLCRTSGSTTYCIIDDTATSKIQPIYETQAEHQKGYTTNLSVTKSVTKTQKASASITVNAGWSFASISSSFNVGNSQSQSVSAGVAYTISSSTASGKYRVAIRFPGKSLSYRSVSKEGVTIGRPYTISYVPTLNAQRKFLQKY